ncbi:MAG: F0F1 ATP synthase subunit A, partial [Chloroflexota bacterium]
MTINWSGKRRWIALLLLIAGILVTVNIKPVIPAIQLPGEAYPGGREILGLPITNTLVGSIIVWVLIGLLIIFVSRARPKDANEVPRGGFYNFFELLFEGLYGFIEGVAGGPYLNQIFKIFMTIFIIVLLSNWMDITPTTDSIGFLEPHLDKTTGAPLNGGYDVLSFGPAYTLNPKCPWVSPEAAAALTADAISARVANGCTSGIGAAPVVEHEGAAVEAVPAEATTVAPVAEATVAAEATAAAGETATTSEANEAAAPIEAAGEAEHHYAPGDPSVPWVVLGYWRAPSTDLNMTAALALIAVVMIQVMGFRALGVNYLTKFFNFGTLFNSPLGGIDVAVGLLELIGEFAKILSFAFRLLGNVFAGSILLFVMSFLLPFLPWPFFILEFFVAVIQALVFGLLTAIFMNLATVSHHEGGHDDGHPIEAS